MTNLRIMSKPLALQSHSKAPLGKELDLYLIKGSPPGITESTYVDAGDTNAKILLVLAVNSLSIISLDCISLNSVGVFVVFS